MIRRMTRELTDEYCKRASEGITRAVLAEIALIECDCQSAGAAASGGASCDDSRDGAVLEPGLLYYPEGKEVDTRSLIDSLMQAGKRVCLPLCTDNCKAAKIPSMEARLVRDLGVLSTGAYGIQEPPDDDAVSEPVPAGEIDLIVLPCLACDTSLGRIGHGAGYYDSFLTGVREDCVTIALCYDEVLVEGVLPREEHDRSVDIVVTEEAVYRWRRI